MRKPLLSVVLLAAFALSSLTGCGAGKSMWEGLNAPGVPVSVANPAETQGQPLDAALNSFGLTRAHQLFDPKTHKPNGAIYIPCNGEALNSCAQHYWTLSSNKLPSVWVRGNKVYMLQGDYHWSVESNFIVDIPATPVSAGATTTWQDFTQLTHDQQAAILGGMTKAKTLFNSDVLHVRKSIYLEPVGWTKAGIFHC